MNARFLQYVIVFLVFGRAGRRTLPSEVVYKAARKKSGFLIFEKFRIRIHEIMKIHATNVAYIDGANLYKGIKELGWELDYKRFRTWLYEKYKVKTAYIFIGLIPKNKGLYERLQDCGFELKFKEIVYDGGTGKPKGNCDADLVLNTVRDVYEGHFEKVIIVASDGDYASLIDFLKGKNKLEIVLSPNNPQKCSILLKRTGASIVYLNDKYNQLKMR